MGRVSKEGEWDGRDGLRGREEARVAERPLRALGLFVRAWEWAREAPGETRMWPVCGAAVEGW